MTRTFLALIGIIVILYLALVLTSPRTVSTPEFETATSATTSAITAKPDTVIASELSIPWDIAFLPDATLLVTERTGDVVVISPNGSTTRTTVSGATGGEGGLLGIVLHPDFAKNSFVYLYLSKKSGDSTDNRVVRYKYDARGRSVLTVDREVIGGIPGALYHDGGRMEFGPDGKLYITTGDATRGAFAQDTKSLAGKILRVNDDGSIPADNPFGNAVWSYGHRNPQGLAWDETGQLWETEHGPTGEGGRCCHDEINKIEKGGNYGWPAVIGTELQSGMIAPAAQSGDDTWAPASLVYVRGALYFGALKDTSLMRAAISDGSVAPPSRVIHDTYGRVRTVRIGPDGMLYITTSNTDGRGRALPQDDRLVRIDPVAFQ